MAAISHIVPHDPDLDLDKQGEGVVLTPEQRSRLEQAKLRQHEQMEHFISKH